MDLKDELIKFYSNRSKHSNYQILPSSLKAILPAKEISTKSRFEAERLKYFLAKLDVVDKSLLDIGGNTGYFCFELLKAGAKSAHLYEGNKEHTQFVKLAAQALNLPNLKVTNDYFDFNGEFKDKYDLVLLLNVLHHLGDDYGDNSISMEKAKQKMLGQLNSMASLTNEMVYQMGYCWQGDRTKLLFANGTKQEMIDFVKAGTADAWDITDIGIAQKEGDQIVYRDMDDTNIKRDDSLGEFLNRPIFIMKSKVS